METSKFPLAQSPLTSPSFQASGSAGNNWMKPMWLCRSISVTPAVPPKFPSIWNGACVSHRLSRVPFFSRLPNRVYAWLPSSRRAQRQTFHPILQPVAPSPRCSNTILAAFASSGVVTGESVRPGCKPNKWFTWRCLSLGSSMSFDHSSNCP